MIALDLYDLNPGTAAGEDMCFECRSIIYHGPINIRFYSVLNYYEKPWKRIALDLLLKAPSLINISQALSQPHNTRIRQKHEKYILE